MLDGYDLNIMFTFLSHLHLFGNYIKWILCLTYQKYLTFNNISMFVIKKGLHLTLIGSDYKIQLNILTIVAHKSTMLWWARVNEINSNVFFIFLSLIHDCKCKCNCRWRKVGMVSRLYVSIVCTSAIKYYSILLFRSQQQ